MSSKNKIFIEYFSLAQNSALSPRESAIIELRYGLISGEPNTFEIVGFKVGVSRERIRQILDRSLRKIVSKGQREIKGGKVTESCAELLLYIENAIRPKDDGAIDRLVDFSESSLPDLPEKYSLSLIAYLAYQNKKEVKPILSKARKLYRECKAAKWKDLKKHALSDKFQELLVYAKWLNSTHVGMVFTPENFSRKRSVSTNGKGKAGEFYSNKMSRLVEYESELELDFFQWLEQLDEVVYYQEQPFEIPYSYEGKEYVYYPDVLMILKNGKAIVSEIKPVFRMALHINLVKWRALKKFCSDQGFGLLVTDGRYAIQEIQKHKVDPYYSKAVLESLKTGALSWMQYKKIKDEFTPSRNDFVALVLNNNLFWRLNPFMLSMSPNHKNSG